MSAGNFPPSENPRLRPHPMDHLLRDKLPEYAAVAFDFFAGDIPTDGDMTDPLVEELKALAATWLQLADDYRYGDDEDFGYFLAFHRASRDLTKLLEKFSMVEPKVERVKFIS